MAIKRFRDMPIRRKIVIITICTTFFVILAAFGLMTFYNYNTRKAELFDNVSFVAAQTADYCALPLRHNSREEVIALLRKLSLNGDVIDAHVFDTDGRVAGHWNSMSHFDKYEFPASPADTEYVKKGIINILTSIYDRGKRIGYLHLRASQTFLNQSTIRNLRFVLLTLLGTILLSYLMSGFLQRHISRPILKLAQVMKIVTNNSDYSIRLSVRGDDEIGELYNGFNKMLEQILLRRKESERAHEEMNRLNKDLELRVILRNAQVENALLKLRNEIEFRKATEESLLNAKEQAEIANRTKSEFLANMSHEVRTPLNAILGFAELLYKSTDDPKQKKYLGIIQQSGTSLLALINDILDLSRIEAGKLELKYHYMDLQKMFFEIKSIFTQKIEDKQLNFDIKIAEGFPALIYLDEIRIRQVLFNLVGNAVKFTDKGSIVLSAKHEKDGENYNITIQVEDTGIGISDEHREEVFEAFRQFQVNSYGDSGGTGLGLAITKRLVTEMGGSITLDSCPGRGSTFSMVLNGLKAQENDDKAETKPAAADNIRFDPAVILIVDDMLFNRELIKGFLRDQDFEFIEAANGDDAVRMAVSFRPDIILMDMIMPKSDGAKAIKALKQNADTRSTPIIAFTAVSDIDDKIKGLIDGFIRKPVSQSDLKSEMRKYMKHTLPDSDHPAASNGNAAHFAPGIAITSSLDDTVNLAELVSILQNDFLPRCDKIKDAIIIDDVEDLARDLTGLADTFGVDYLVDYSNSLFEAAEDCNIPKIKAGLENFEKIYYHLNSLYGNL